LHGARQVKVWRPDWRLGLMLLWVAGVAAAFAQMLITYAGLRRLRHAARPSESRDLAIKLALHLGISHPLQVLETSAGAMPMTFGVLRPAVLLPGDAAGWSEERRRIVLLHELAHVRRGDAATQLLARLALIQNWWNPLAWIAWRKFLRERERATDDLVLSAGAPATEYASHLLEVARNMQIDPVLRWATVAMARPSQLEARIAAILDSRVNRKAAGRASALAAALVAVAIVVPLAAVRAQDRVAPSIPADVDATIRAAIAQRNYQMLEKPAAALETLREYDSARKLLDTAVAIREEVSGKGSVEDGVGLMKIGELEKLRMRNHGKDAEAFYTQALSVLGDRAESAPALMYLGLRKMKNLDDAVDYFQRAQRVDPSLAGPATMWMALVRERQQNPAEAEALYKSALAAQNPNSAGEESTLLLYARFLKEQGREPEATSMLERAAAIRKTLVSQANGQLTAQSQTPVLRVGGGVTAPRVLFPKTDPEYSEEARAAKYAGTVVLYLEIFPDGTARNIRVVKGLGFGLDEKATEAVSYWHFQPGTKDGSAVTVAAHIEVNFRLF
jgi:TonB family protein